MNRTFDDGTKVQTFTSYLSVNAVRSTNSQDGIDHCSANNSTVCAVASTKVPTLITAMGAYHLLRDEELMFDKPAADDKDYIVIEGAELNYTPCKSMRGDARPVLEHAQEHVRLHPEMGKHPVLIARAQGSGHAACLR